MILTRWAPRSLKNLGSMGSTLAAVVGGLLAAGGCRSNVETMALTDGRVPLCSGEDGPCQGLPSNTQDEQSVDLHGK